MTNGFRAERYHGFAFDRQGETHHHPSGAMLTETPKELLMEPLTQTVWRWNVPLCLLSWGSILVGGCVFRSMPPTDSNTLRPPIPTEPGRLF